MDKISDLNDLLGRELGRRADGHPIFAWKNSDDLFWPAARTGRNVVTRIEVPLILPVEVDCPDCKGTGYEPWTDEPETCSGCSGTKKVTQTSDITETVLPEYARDRQLRAEDTWVVTKWLSPEELIWGWVGRHGQPDPAARPDHETLVRMWGERFPGADFPSAGWRIPTDASLPRWPGGPRVPDLSATRFFIAAVKEQTRLNFSERLADMELARDRQDDATRKEIEDCARDAFGAFLNPTPGKRSSFVSFPWTRRDRV